MTVDSQTNTDRQTDRQTDLEREQSLEPEIRHTSLVLVIFWYRLVLSGCRFYAVDNLEMFLEVC